MPRTGDRTNGPRLARLSRGVLAVGIVLLFVGGGLSAVASPVPAVERVRSDAVGGPTGSSTSVILEVNLTDNLSFSPNALIAAAGASVTFVLHNVGQYPHSFTLSNVANYTLNRSWSPGELDAFLAGNTSVNRTLAPQNSTNLTFGIPATWAGASFEFVSIVPYQFQAGMLGFLNVTGTGGGATATITDQTAISSLAFVPAAIQVNTTGYPLTIEIQVSNLGTTAHTWTLVAQPNVNVTPGGFASYFQAHPPAANVNVPTSPGVTATANFTVSAKGVYMYICEIPGHFAAGMFGFLYIGVPAPSAAPAPSTQVVATWALAGAGGILAIGIGLAVAAAYVGRFPPKPPAARHH